MWSQYKLDPSESYMVLEQEPKRAFEIFEEHVLHGWRGLCITREHPKQVRERYNLKSAQVFWLTDLKPENTVNDLLEISLLIGGFLNSNESAIALLDGLEYLVTRYGFEATYHFIQNKRSQTATTESILLILVHPKAFPEEELALLERVETITVIGCVSRLLCIRLSKLNCGAPGGERLFGSRAPSTGDAA